MTWTRSLARWLSFRWARTPLARVEAWERRMHEGMTAFQAGRPEDAERAYSDALAEAEFFAPGDPRLTVSLDSLIGLYRLEGKYREAEPLGRRALEIKERTHGPRHPNLASTLSDLAEIYRALGQEDRAAECRRRALGVLEQAIGPDFQELDESLGKSRILTEDEDP